MSVWRKKKTTSVVYDDLSNYLVSLHYCTFGRGHSMFCVAVVVVVVVGATSSLLRYYQDSLLDWLLCGGGSLVFEPVVFVLEVAQLKH